MPRSVTHTKEWYARCTTCIYARFTGASGPNAFSLATKHFHKTGHSVKVGKYGTVDVTVGHDDVTQSSLGNLAEPT
jgi:hypothetical protein